MNYRTKPDLSRNQALTLPALVLFQRFQQEADTRLLERWTEREVRRHLKLCELVILKGAQAGYYWAELPAHPLPGITVEVHRQLEKSGFKVEHQEYARKRKMKEGPSRTEEIDVTEIRSSWTASWLGANRSSDERKEWNRREALEDAERVKHPPKPQSIVVDGQITESRAVWAGLLDKKYLAEVQWIHGRAFLCVFDLDGRCRHTEETDLAYGAVFGPDICDAQKWQERTLAIIAAWKV